MTIDHAPTAPRDPGSTVPRRQLGRYLRQLREEAQLTVKAAAEELEWSTPKIWRIETGATSMRALDVEAMCRLYGATSETTKALMGLARETKARGWWHSYADAIPPWFELYVGLESAAVRLRQYEPELVPALLQTEAYASEVLRIAHPALSDAEVKRGVAVRLERQSLVSRRRPPPPLLEVVLNEAVLRRRLRDRAAMAEQLHHINTIGELPTVSVRVLPFGAGLHRAAMANGSFVILGFKTGTAARGGEPPTVYSDGLTSALYLDKPEEVAAYDEVWSGILDGCLGEAPSRKLIARVAGEHA